MKENVLITGAAGFIGTHLRNRFAQDNKHTVRLFVISKSDLSHIHENEIIMEGNTFDTASLERSLNGVDIAYYLIHSMGSKGDFKKKDKESAENFLNSCVTCGVKRIIYLGGLGTRESGSPHLVSRIETGEILSSIPDRIQTLWFRAGIIIGTGGASFEIIRHLVKRLPVMITPTWVRTKTEPIALSDVVEYLYQACTLKDQNNYCIDIGSGAMTFEEMLQGAARQMKVKRLIIPVPFFSPNLSSYWLKLITPVPLSISRPLVAGLKSETIKLNTRAAELFPAIAPMEYEKAFQLSLQNKIYD